MTCRSASLWNVGGATKAPFPSSGRCVMATFLYRMGRFCFSRRWLVAGVWVLMLGLLGAGAATLSGTMSNTFSVPGTESQKAIDQLAERFPQAHVGGATARVVFVA